MTNSTPPVPADCRRDSGTFVKLQGDTLTLSAGGSTKVFSRASLTRLEVSSGRRSLWLRGAGIGFAVGAGAVFIAAKIDSRQASPCSESSQDQVLAFFECVAVVGGGIVGGVTGALIGRNQKTDRWREAPFDGLQISAAPRPGYFELRGTVRF